LIKKLIITILGFIFFINVQAQRAQVEFRADSTQMDVRIGRGAYRLKGNVVFTHEGAKMYCDSAYFYRNTNSLDAFNNIHINQADSVHLYGDIMHYDGNSRLARIQRNVRLEGNNTKLTTTELDFDLGQNVGYYTRNAEIVSGENHMSSIRGYYYVKDETYYFRDSVVIINPDYIINSDTLKYNTSTNVAWFLGPTEITSDTGYIYCESGWYNTKANTSFLKDNALVRNENQTITADSMYYERETGYGEAFSDIMLEDASQNVILKGNHAFIRQKENYALLTDSAIFIYITDSDSIYAHADTLLATTDENDQRHLYAYYGVRFFKSDLQGKCDSLYYSTADSILKMYNDPVLWSGRNQLTAAFIEVRTKNREINQLYLDSIAFIINMSDTSKYNQIKGRTMTGYFRDSDLYRLDVNGNGQTVYYVKDENGYTGVNLAESSDITIMFSGNEVDRINFKVKPNAVLYPLDLAPEEELLLDDFVWYESQRPVSKNDIFRK
jgi:lipopolysaccharide export system protein LptA